MTPRPLSVLAAILLLHVLLALPAHPDQLAWAALARPAPELAVLILLALAAGRTVAGRLLRVAATLALTLVTVLKVADLAMLESLGRRFNPVADLPLIDASVRLIAGSPGPWQSRRVRFWPRFGHVSLSLRAHGGRWAC